MNLELGGGSTPRKKAEGFLNVDIRWLPEVDYIGDLSKIWQFWD